MTEQRAQAGGGNSTHKTVWDHIPEKNIDQNHLQLLRRRGGTATTKQAGDGDRTGLIFLTEFYMAIFLEQLFSVATGRLDKLLSVVSIILGSSVIGGFIPEISGVFIVVIATVQTIYGFGQKSGNAMINPQNICSFLMMQKNILILN
ncbi:hypothetical protein ACLB1S_11555 [Escherichia coli]